VVYYVLLQPYALEVGLPIATLGIVVAGVQLTTVVASWLAFRATRSFTLPTIVTAGVGILILAVGLLGLLPSIPSIALVLVVALIPALLAPLLMARLNDLIPSAQRATILSLSSLMFELGLAVAMPLLLVCPDRLRPPPPARDPAGVFA